MFEVGSKYTNTCWFSGGSSEYTVVSRTENTVTFSQLANELDGVHNTELTYDVNVDENGIEYILLYEYHGHENRIYSISYEPCYDVIEDVASYLWSYDAKPTKKLIKETINKWIENLYSHIGAEAYKHSLSCGVVDKTGMTWEEQDMQMLQQIDKYKKCLMYM